MAQHGLILLARAIQSLGKAGVKAMRAPVCWCQWLADATIDEYVTYRTWITSAVEEALSIGVKITLAIDTGACDAVFLTASLPGGSSGPAGAWHSLNAYFAGTLAVEVELHGRTHGMMQVRYAEDGPWQSSNSSTSAFCEAADEQARSSESLYTKSFASGFLPAFVMALMGKSSWSIPALTLCQAQVVSAGPNACIQ